MSDSELTRRDFEKLAMAAFGGLVAGAGLERMASAADKAPEKKNPLLSDAHVCRGLNTCKGKDAGGKATCAGTGQCATAEAHTCHKKNACRGQGGCGAHPGENECKTMGECGVPLKEAAWKKARARYEELMKKDGKKFGDAPKK